MTMVRLAPAARHAIETHGVETYPHECCGALYGTEDGVIVEALPLANTTRKVLAGASSCVRRITKPQRRTREEQTARSSGSLTRIQTTPRGRQSTTSIHAWPNFVYVIASVLERRVDATTAWRLREDRSRLESTEQSP